MSRFNSPTVGTKTINKAGGEAFSQSPKLELVSILLTSFANDQFYRSAGETFDRIKELIGKITDKSFVAKAAVYARTKFGMRSITHVLASELSQYIKGESWARKFYSSIIYRPDDMMEILSYHKSKQYKLTNAIRKGFSTAFGRFDKYTLAKYRGNGKDIKLVDVVNIVHPKPTEKNREALEALIKGELKSFDTWETELTKAGQSAETDEEKAELKKDAWVKLIREKKIGYFALLRNLRNIVEQAPEIIDEAIALLKDEKLIRKSLVLPFRYSTAYGEIEKLSGKDSRKVLGAISDALDIAVGNVPVFDGETLVVLDDSGSMGSTGISNKSAFAIGSLFASVLVKSNNADFMMFSDDARYYSMNTRDSAMSLIDKMDKHRTSNGTNFHSIFMRANRKYDRIIILSDMQGWMGHNAPTQSFEAYKLGQKANPFIYSFDLNNYGSMQFPERNVFAIAGFSEKVFDLMKMLETDKNALINEIERVELG